MKTQKYKGFTIVLVESPNGCEKWYNVFENDIKHNNDIRSLNSVAKAKQFINALVDAAAAVESMKNGTYRY